MCCYTSELYRTETYNPEMWADVLTKKWTIDYERYRTLIIFLTPRKIKCTEEILLYNTGAEASHIIYDLSEFKQQLYVYDSDDKKLEFHSFSDPNDPSKYLIKIEFPSGKSLKKGDYRTISLHYYIEVSARSRYHGLYSIPLDLAKTSYINFEKPKEYCISLNFLKLGKSEEITVLFDKDDELAFEETDLKVQIIGKNIVKSKELLVMITPDLHEEQKIWFDLGTYIGLLSAVLILTELILIPQHPTDNFIKYVPIIIPLAAAVITSLIVIKGWIFTKDMDWILNDINKTKSEYFTYDRVYIAIICIVIVEIAIAVSLCIQNAIR
jgi:hypothetical protein